MYTVHHPKGKLPTAGLQIVDAAPLNFRESEELSFGGISYMIAVMPSGLRRGKDEEKLLEIFLSRCQKSWEESEEARL